jgi:hypothetical protein
VAGLDPIYNQLDFLFKRFNHKNLTSKSLTGIPYYIPKWLGGLGMDPGPDFVKMIDKRQRQQAYYIYSKLKDVKPTSVAGLKESLLDELITKYYKFSFKKHQIEADFEYPFHTLETEEQEDVELITENLRVSIDLLEHFWRTKSLRDLLQGKEFNMDDQFDPEKVELYKKRFHIKEITEAEILQDENVLLDSTRACLAVDDMNIGALSEKRVREAYRHNSRIWLAAFRNANYSENMYWHKLWHQPQPSNLAVIQKSKDRDFQPILDAAF